jgi:hypothetical protein
MKIMTRFLMVIFVLLAVVPLPAGQQNPALSKGGLIVGGQPDAPIRMEVFSCYQCPPVENFILRLSGRY